MAKGYMGGRHRLFKTATEAVDKALCYAYRDRRTRKREFRSLWIVRIGAAAKQNGVSYSKLMGGLKKANIEIDRKILAALAENEPQVFEKIANEAKKYVEVK